MKFNSPENILEVIPNLAWIYESKAIISLYSLREEVSAAHNTHSCMFEKAIDIIKMIDSAWNITHWCFDWTAERDLFLYDETINRSSPIFEVISVHLLAPLSKIINFDYVKLSFIHGDLDISKVYDEWAMSAKGAYKFNYVKHVNRFFYLYNEHAFPSIRPQSLVRASYTTFNRKFTHYRSALLEYLKNNNLIDKGYVNFAFDNTSTLNKSLPKQYEGNVWQTESEVCKYYSASNFDIIVETTSTGENRTFITEKTMRALALGQPFVTYNGPNALSHLQSLGFKTYSNFWNEEYDKIIDPKERFDAMIKIAHNLIDNPSIFENSGLKEISLHNQYHFQKLSQKDHRQTWFETNTD